MSDRSPVSRRTALKTLGTLGAVGVVGAVPSLADTSSAGDGATVAWERRYRKTLDDELYVDGVVDVVELDTGYLLGGGVREDRGPGIGRIWLARVDEGGQRRWERTYPAGEESGLNYEAMVPTADDGYAVAADGGEDGYHHGYGLKVDSNGEVLWRIDLGKGSADAVAAVGDGTVFAGIDYGDDAGGRSDLLQVTKRAPDGSEAWTWTGPVDPTDDSETDGSPKNHAGAAIGTADGGVLVAGTTDYYRAGSVEGLLKFAADGTLEWRSVEGSAGLDDRYEGETADVDDLIQREDGGYAVLGDSGSYEDGDVVLTRVDDAGEVTDAASLEGPTDGADDASGFVRSGSGYTIAANADGDPDRAQVIETTDGTTVEWATLLEDAEFDLYAADVVGVDAGAVVGGGFGRIKGDNGGLLLKLVEEGGGDDEGTTSTTTDEGPAGTTTTTTSTPTETAEPDDGESTTAEPDDGESTTAEPDDGESTTAEPEEGTPTTTTTDPVDEDGDGCAKDD